MKKYTRMFKYLKAYRTNLAFYFGNIVLSILFSMVSLSMLAPFLQILFGKSATVSKAPELNLSIESIFEYLRFTISQIIINHGPLRALAFICITIISTIFLKNFFLYLALRFLAPIRNGIMTKLRGDLYDKVLQLPVGYFTEQRKGDLISRMSNDVNEVEWSVVNVIETLIREPLNILFYLILMIILSPQLSLFLLIFLPVTVLIIGRVSRKLKKKSNEAQEKTGTAISLLDETLGGMRVVKAFTAEMLLGKRFHTVNEDLNHVRNKINFRRDLASPLSEIMGVGVLCGILWFGGQLVLNKTSADLNADTFITYILFFTQIINPAKHLSSAFYNLRRGSAAIERIEEILSAPLAIEDAKDAIDIKGFEKEIEFRNVTFRYDDKPVLKNISFTLKKGQTIALAGSSGSGKSTLSDLIPRFHDVEEGEILIDGINIRKISLKSLRKLFGIVTQEPVLFNDTITNNILLGKPEASKEEMEKAAKIANAHHFISQKEEGYETNVGDRGSKLSGGERQRLTIARAVLKNPPILILDEATSSLDTESERLVQDAINHLMESRTSLVIAHRLSTIRHADLILVLQNGEITERGNHEELILKNGFYKRLVEMQEVK
jgi:subfamily B ATP-binding cassette protein MsbA